MFHYSFHKCMVCVYVCVHVDARVSTVQGIYTDMFMRFVYVIFQHDYLWSFLKGWGSESIAQRTDVAVYHVLCNVRWAALWAAFIWNVLTFQTSRRNRHIHPTKSFLARYTQATVGWYSLRTIALSLYIHPNRLSDVNSDWIKGEEWGRTHTFNPPPHPSHTYTHTYTHTHTGWGHLRDLSILCGWDSIAWRISHYRMTQRCNDGASESIVLLHYGN